MGWFGRRRDPQDASEMLRRYNDAEAVRLAALANGSVADASAPTAFSAASSSAELVIEDVFMITGRGQVVTGTVSSGTVRVGDQVVMLRGATAIGSSEIAGIEMFRKTAQEATVGTMAGLVLRGRFDLARGDVIRTAASA